MCGLVGVFQRAGNRVEPDVLARMAEVIRHRGPDDEGQWIDGEVGLHHLRLSVIDLATGHQPMQSGPAVIAFNGEIYNYVELREELKTLGCEFRTSSDTEVILQGYLQHGPAFVDRLNGMFAFVLVDRARGIAVAARDHFGIKPLYLHVTPEHILFASEIKALLRHPEAPGPTQKNSRIRNFPSGWIFEDVPRGVPQSTTRGFHCCRSIQRASLGGSQLAEHRTNGRCDKVRTCDH